jgi:hypothetical protein
MSSFNFGASREQHLGMQVGARLVPSCAPDTVVRTFSEQFLLSLNGDPCGPVHNAKMHSEPPTDWRSSSAFQKASTTVRKLRRRQWTDHLNEEFMTRPPQAHRIEALFEAASRTLTG